MHRGDQWSAYTLPRTRRNREGWATSYFQTRGFHSEDVNILHKDECFKMCRLSDTRSSVVSAPTCESYRTLRSVERSFCIVPSSSISPIPTNARSASHKNHADTRTIFSNSSLTPSHNLFRHAYQVGKSGQSTVSNFLASSSSDRDKRLTELEFNETWSSLWTPQSRQWFVTPTGISELVSSLGCAFEGRVWSAKCDTAWRACTMHLAS